MQKEVITLRNYAHIGDAVWELFVREYTVFKTQNAKILHKITTDRVNTVFQKNLLNIIMPELTDEELELVKRARNLPIPVARRTIQKDYRQATAFEALIGIWYLHNKPRLLYFYEKFKTLDAFN